MKVSILSRTILMSALLLASGCDESEPSTESSIDMSADVSTDDVSSTDVGLDATADTSQTDVAADVAVEEDLNLEAECTDGSGVRPPQLSEHEGVYSIERKEFAMFGGSTGVPVDCDFPVPTFESSVWVYSETCGEWFEFVDPAGPVGRTRHMLTYDSQERRMILFGGRRRASTSGPYDLLSDVWAFDLDTRTWEQLADAGSGPGARVNGAIAYDASLHRIVLFGGNRARDAFPYEPLKDVWSFSLNTNTWSRLQPTGGPEPRLFHSAAWDPKRNRMVIFGGSDNSSFGGVVEYFSDLWSLDFSEGAPIWERIDTSTRTPQGRFWGGMMYDEVGDTYVLFGGHDDGQLGNRNDLEIYNPSNGLWATITRGDEYNAPANGVCDFPPDFTTLDEPSPERRNAHAFAGGGGVAYSMGGKTDCGVVDDFAKLDLASNTWSRVTRATQGEVCLRRGGGDSCSSLCF